MSESARKNVGSALMANRKFQYVEYLRSEILLCGGNTEDKRAFDLQIIT